MRPPGRPRLRWKDRVENDVEKAMPDLQRWIPTTDIGETLNVKQILFHGIVSKDKKLDGDNADGRLRSKRGHFTTSNQIDYYFRKHLNTT